MSLITPAILVKGLGKCQGPLSRVGMPKQFTPLPRTHSTFRQTLPRVTNRRLFERPVIAITSYHFRAERQAQQIDAEIEILVEPPCRDSGPAIADAHANSLGAKAELALAFGHLMRHQNIDHCARICAKRIIVRLGAKLRMQGPRHRTQHWVMDSGIAEATLNGAITTLQENPPIYIQIRGTHRLGNGANAALEFVEEQTGGDLEENIILCKDIYARRIVDRSPFTGLAPMSA